MRNGPYNLVVAPVGYPGKRYRGLYAYEHTVQWWKKHKKIPRKGFEIHHKDGNHRNNKIGNLQLMTSAKHKALHADLARLKPVKRECSECLNIFESRHSRKTFCSRNCAGKRNQRVRTYE